MWKILIELVTHRLFLLAVALCAINVRLAPNEGSGIRSLQPTSVLLSGFVDRVRDSKEAQALEGFSGTSLHGILFQTKDPFIWLAHGLKSISGLSAVAVILILSNLFLLLFLFDLHSMVSQMTLPEVADATCALTLLWLTSYELSLGSTLALACYLATKATYHALANQWFLCGLALAFLSLTKPFALALLPMCLVFFWGYQRHFEMVYLIQNLVALVLPLGAAVYWNWGYYQNWQGILNDSALFNLVAAWKSSGGFHWTLSQTYFGQTLSIAILVAGAVTSFVVYSQLLHRLLPMYLLLAMLISTPYSLVATGALLAAPIFSGIAGASTPVVLRLVQMLFLTFGAIEVFRIF